MNHTCCVLGLSNERASRQFDRLEKLVDQLITVHHVNTFYLTDCGFPEFLIKSRIRALAESRPGLCAMLVVPSGTEITPYLHRIQRVIAAGETPEERDQWMIAHSRFMLAAETETIMIKEARCIH